MLAGVLSRILKVDASFTKIVTSSFSPVVRLEPDRPPQLTPSTASAALDPPGGPSRCLDHLRPPHAMTPHVTASLASIVLFVLGVVCGVFLALRFQFAPSAAKFSAEEWAAQTLAQYQDMLALTDEQSIQVREAAGEAARNMVRIRENTKSAIQETVKTMNSAILPNLDESQRATLEAWIEERREAMAGT